MTDKTVIKDILSDLEDLQLDDAVESLKSMNEASEIKKELKEAYEKDTPIDAKGIIEKLRRLMR